MKNIISLIALVLTVIVLTSTVGCATKNNYSRTTETWYPDGKPKGKEVETDKSWSVNQPFAAGASQPARVVRGGRRHVNLLQGGFRIGGGSSDVVYDMDHGSPIRLESANPVWNHNAPMIVVPSESQEHNMRENWRRYH